MGFHYGRVGSGIVIALAACLLTAASPSQAPPHKSSSVLTSVADVPLPGPPIRFDYQSLDTLSNRLYISHMRAGQVLVFDVKGRALAGTIGDLPNVTGVWAVPALGKVYASVPGQRHVAVIDARTLRVIARVGTIGFPDGIAYAAAAKKIYVSDESGRGELVIDGARDRVVTVIPLGGEAGNTLYDPVGGHVWVAVQTRQEVVEIDPAKDRVVARHRFAGASHPHGMSLDPSRRRLFVANEDNAKLLVVDLTTLAVVQTVEVGDDPYVLALDPTQPRLYVASESGKVSVFTEQEGRLVLEGTLEMPHAHTVSVDPRTHWVYFPLQEVEGRPILRIMAPVRP